MGSGLCALEAAGTACGLQDLVSTSGTRPPGARPPTSSIPTPGQGVLGALRA